MKRIKYKNIGEELINNPYPSLFGKKTQISRYVVSSDAFFVNDIRILVIIDNQNVNFEFVRETDGVTIFKYEDINNHVVLRRKVKEELEKRGVNFGKEKRNYKFRRTYQGKRIGFVLSPNGQREES